jgi:hypothetical protein
VNSGVGLLLLLLATINLVAGKYKKLSKKPFNVMLRTHRRNLPFTVMLRTVSKPFLIMLRILSSVLPLSKINNKSNSTAKG